MDQSNVRDQSLVNIYIKQQIDLFLFKRLTFLMCDEYDGGENDRFNEEPPDEDETEEGARSRRNIPKVNYKLFDREGRKN